METQKRNSITIGVYKEAWVLLFFFEDLMFECVGESGNVHRTLLQFCLLNVTLEQQNMLSIFSNNKLSL